MVGFISCILGLLGTHSSFDTFRDVLTSDVPGCDSYPPPKTCTTGWRPTVASGLYLYHLRLSHGRICGERKVHRNDMDRSA